jgi:hypothetical protein
MLTPAQLVALRAAVLANPTASAFLSAGDAAGLQAHLNAPSPFIVWRTFVTKDEMYGNGFNWVAIDDVLEPKWRVWTEMFDNADKACNPSKLNIRDGIAEVWKGNAAKLAVQSYLLEKCKRAATNAERLLASGTGGSQATPGNLTWEGDITGLDSAMLIFRDDGTIWS